MFEKKSLIATAILAGLVSGIALADETAPPAKKDGAKVEKKNDCKGMKDDCNAEMHHHAKHAKHMKHAKDACSGPNGCDGSDMKKKDGAPAPASVSPTKKAK
jgi:hypothetical protein